MAPFTPFLTEGMYRNLRRALPPGAPESVHFCEVPQAQEVRPGRGGPLLPRARGLFLEGSSWQEVAGALFPHHTFAGAHHTKGTGLRRTTRAAWQP